MSDLITNFVYCGNYLCPGFKLCGPSTEALSNQEINRGYCATFYYGKIDDPSCKWLSDEIQEADRVLTEFCKEVF